MRRQPYKPFSAWDDAKFTVGGLLLICSPLLLIGLIVGLVLL